MSEVLSTSKIEVSIILKLEENEARALLALTEYGDNEFLQAFYKNLGTVGLKPHEDGLKKLFSVVKNELPKHLKKADDARNILKK